MKSYFIFLWAALLGGGVAMTAEPTTAPKPVPGEGINAELLQTRIKQLDDAPISTTTPSRKPATSISRRKSSWNR